MSPISSARRPISFITPADSVMDWRIREKPEMERATVAPPSRAVVLTRSPVARASSAI